jgi:hypothetical protein
MMIIGISSILNRLCSFKLPDLCHRRSTDDFSDLKKLRLVYETTLPDGLHWTHSDRIQFKDTGICLPIAMHPYLTAMAYFIPRNQANMFHEENRMPLQECEVYMDENIVLRFRQTDNNSVVEQRYPYTVPVDPLCVP